MYVNLIPRHKLAVWWPTIREWLDEGRRFDGVSITESRGVIAAKLRDDEHLSLLLLLTEDGVPCGAAVIEQPPIGGDMKIHLMTAVHPPRGWMRALARELALWLRHFEGMGIQGLGIRWQQAFAPHGLRPMRGGFTRRVA